MLNLKGRIGVAKSPLDEGSAILASRFRKDIETKLSRVSPRTYLPQASALLASVYEARDVWPLWPPHMILHSMEACCSYHGTHDDPVDQAFLAELIDIYKAYPDPVIVRSLEKGTPKDREFAIMQMIRTQYPIQRRWNQYDFARAICLFIQSPYPTILPKFVSLHGFDFASWIELTFCVAAVKSPVMNEAYLFRSEALTYPEDVVRKVLKELSRSVQELKEGFDEARKSYGPHMEWNIPSQLVRTPLIDLGGGDYVVSHRPFVLGRACQGLYDMCRQNGLNEFGEEYGSAFETYVGRVLGAFPNVVNLLTEDQMKELVSGKVCDYLVEFPTCILLVDCKAVEYTATYLSESAIAGNNSTTKVAKAVSQVWNVAGALKRGVLEPLIGDGKGKFVVGAVITFREIPRIGGSVYWGIVSPLVEVPEGAPSLDEVFTFRPQIMDVASLEALGIKLLSGATLEEVISSKGEESDWGPYLAHDTSVNEHAFPLLDEVFGTYAHDIMEKIIAAETAHGKHLSR